MLKVYDYRCTHCGHEFDRIVRDEERDLQVCAICMHDADRVPSVPAMVEIDRGRADGRHTFHRSRIGRI